MLLLLLLVIMVQREKSYGESSFQVVKIRKSLSNYINGDAGTQFF
jgi:hypothetical protein